MLTKKQMKVELTRACKSALHEYMRTTRGAFAFGPHVEITEPTPNKLLLRAKTEVGVQFFEVIVKETW